MATKVTPTFLLKGIDISKVLAEYQAGVFSRVIKPKSKIKIAQNTVILAPQYGVSNHDPIFCSKDKHNCSVIYATTGHQAFEVFTTSGGKLPVGGLCDNCHRDFDHTAVGYPVGYQELSILFPVEDNPDLSVYRIIYVFWVEGKFCTFECALGWIRIMLAHPAEYRDTLLRDSERMLKLLYKLTYPEAKVLRPAQDPRLLISNGGSLSFEEWQDGRHIYTRTDRVLMIPAKVEYIRQDYNAPILIPSSIDCS